VSRAYTEGQIEVVPVLLPLIDGISSVRVYVPKDLRTPDARKSVGKTLAEVHKRFKDGVPLLDPIEDMHIEDDNFKKIIRVPPDRRRICDPGVMFALTITFSFVYRQKIEMLEDRLNSNPAFKEPSLEQRYALYVKKMVCAPLSACLLPPLSSLCLILLYFLVGRGERDQAVEEADQELGGHRAQGPAQVHEARAAAAGPHQQGYTLLSFRFGAPLLPQESIDSDLLRLRVSQTTSSR
jgi:hypothetical protein